MTLSLGFTQNEHFSNSKIYRYQKETKVGDDYMELFMLCNHFSLVGFACQTKNKEI